MKYFAYLMAMGLILSVVTLFFLKRPDGLPWLTTDPIKNNTSELKARLVSLSSDSFNDVSQFVSDTSDNVIGHVTNHQTPSTTVYKWQESSGIWHFSDRPNPAKNSQKVLLDPNDMTVIPAEDRSMLKGSAKSGGILPTQSPENNYSPVVIKKLFDDAKNTKMLINKRAQELNHTH